MSTLIELAKKAKKASCDFASISTQEKNQALMAIAHQLEHHQAQLLEANKEDITRAKEKGLSEAMIDRLRLDDGRIMSMVEACTQIADLADPIGEISDCRYQANGVQVGQMCVPLGVIGIIYESRPNVTIDATALCIKSSNAVILRGGSESIHTNLALIQCIQRALSTTTLNPDSVQLIQDTNRERVGELIQMNDYVDVIIPRGGKSLIERISEQATIPVIKHLDGICHVYIDDSADNKKAFDIAVNAKTHRYGVCNAMETLLVHKEKALEVLPQLCQEYSRLGVELRGCAQTKSIAEKNNIPITEATQQDWQTEYLAPILSIRIVDSYHQAVDHIAQYSSAHTESIVTENYSVAKQFLREVDSSSVMVNASTRFADGFEYGLGAEIGISTDKLHARGPVGIQGLTSQKYIVFGDGDIRQ